MISEWAHANSASMLSLFVKDCNGIGVVDNADTGFNVDVDRRNGGIVSSALLDSVGVVETESRGLAASSEVGKADC